MRKLIGLLSRLADDKCKHFLVGLLLTWVLYTIYFHITHLLWDSLVVTEVVVLFVTLWKEVMLDDEFDAKDFLTTVVGNLMALAMIFI